MLPCSIFVACIGKSQDEANALKCRHYAILSECLRKEKTSIHEFRRRGKAVWYARVDAELRCDRKGEALFDLYRAKSFRMNEDFQDITSYRRALGCDPIGVECRFDPDFGKGRFFQAGLA